MKTFAIIVFAESCLFAGIASSQDGPVQSGPVQSGPVQSGPVQRGTSADALWGHPSTNYLILPRPSTHGNKGQPHTYVAPKNPIESKPASPYAYGWFGTKPSQHWHRQFGSQNAYTQWTLR